MSTASAEPTARPLDYRKNPFTLVYDGALTKNKPGKVNIHPVRYKLHEVDIAANVYTPAGYDPTKKYPAIVVAHPNGGVKEQTAGLYAQHLAEEGYVTIAMDAAYQGASGGDATDQIDLIDIPLLMMAGSKADTLYMTEDAFPKATGNKDKELFRIEGARHIETYWVQKYVRLAMGKLTPFFARSV